MPKDEHTNETKHPDLHDKGTGDSSFTIVGIGASAGGLEALNSFLGSMPENNGMAFIIVQHLDPTRKDILVELLQRVTTMKVVQATEGTALSPDCVYVIPPNKNLSISGGVLHLSEHTLPRGLRLPIDFFFRSLAEDQQEKSIGIILSGMGTDGTSGIRDIKERGGMVFVQEPSTAQFDGMPSSAIAAGHADIVAPADALPAKILDRVRRKPLNIDANRNNADSFGNTLSKIVSLLRAHTGHDFSAYKKTTLWRRIERRMGIKQLEIEAYIQFLRDNPQEVDILFKEFLIGVTSFFREPAEWEILKEKAIPTLLARVSSQTLRAWVPACATGEEAYSLAIVFKEALDQLEPAQNYKLQIFATDLDSDAIDKAREAIFPANIAEDVSSERLRRFFVEVDRGYQVTKPIRDMVIFAAQNLIMDPPFTKLDVLSCRNLLIYLNSELQKKLLPLFHYSLNPGGFLFLGSAETVGTSTDLFESLHNKSRIYQRLQVPLQAEHLGFPSSFVPAHQTSLQPAKTIQNIQLLADQLILQYHSPATVLVNDKGDILYITGRTGKYLEPAAGRANWNVFAMAREGLRYQLNDIFQTAVHQQKAVTYKSVNVVSEGGHQAVDITVQPLQEPESLRRMVMIIFKEVAEPPQAKTNDIVQESTGHSPREHELERDLAQIRYDLQIARAEMQASQEELKSYNEELQSTNEELQSANEELTTSREEMHSLNEELQTVNYELQDKVNELSLANNDMKNLLDSTKIATLFLDNNLSVRRFTSQMSAITNLIPGDVGRPVTDIASELFYPELAEDILQVLKTLNTIEKQVASGNGYWFNVKILPYRTLDDRIDGVVVTFVEINESKLLEAELRVTQAALEERLSNQGQELALAKDRLLDEVQRGQRESAAGKATKRSTKPT